MAVIGVELGRDQLVLTKGRDFFWTFDNQDDEGTPVEFEPGELFFELRTGGEQNAIQRVKVTGASSGTYSFTFKNETTDPIDYYDNVENPRGLDGDVRSALEGLATIGPGNVRLFPAQLYPVWVLKFRMNAPYNEIQQIKFRGNPSGGTFNIGLGFEFTDQLPYDAAPEVVEAALENLPSIGAGNVSVKAITDGYQIEFINAKGNQNIGQLVAYNWFTLRGGFFPTVHASTLINGTGTLSEQFVSMLNKTLNDFFNSFEQLIGVDLDFEIHDDKNVTFKVTSMRSFVESDIITWATNIGAVTIEGFINNVLQLTGLFDLVHVDFYWDHVYNVEFIGDLGYEPQPLLIANTDQLGGDGEQNVEVEEMVAGVNPVTNWHFDIDGSRAQIKVESEDADEISNHVHWQLVWLPDGEPAGGQALALGFVRIQGE